MMYDQMDSESHSCHEDAQSEDAESTREGKSTGIHARNSDYFDTIVDSADHGQIHRGDSFIALEDPTAENTTTKGPR